MPKASFKRAQEGAVDDIGSSNRTSLIALVFIGLFCFGSVAFFHPNFYNDVSSMMVISRDVVMNSTSLNMRIPKNAISDYNGKKKEPTTFCGSLSRAVETRIVDKEERPTVHVFVTNSGHFQLLLNSLASIQLIGTKLGVSKKWKSLVLGLDEKVCTSLLPLVPPEHRDDVVCIPYGQRLLNQMKQDEPESYAEYLRVNKTLNETAGWGSAMHKVLINSKLYALRDTIHCGLDTFISDTDIVFMKDPWPYFINGTYKTDIIAQNDTNPKHNKLNMNSGFMFWKSNALSRNLTQAVVKEMTWWAIDQSRVNNLLFDRHIPITLLPCKFFPNGAILTGMNSYQVHEEAVAIHVNWNGHFDEKKAILIKRGIWLLPPDDEG